MSNEDARNYQEIPLTIDFSYSGGFLILNDPTHATKQILDHFHSINSPEFMRSSDWEIMLNVIPAIEK